MADGQQGLDKSVQSKTKYVIVQILGAVRTNVELKGRPADNSTRWVFDVESETLSDESSADEEIVVLHLLDPRNEKMIFNPDIFSCSLTPLCDAFYQARPYIMHRDDGAFVLHARRIQGAVRYRVGIDTIHSATR